LVSRFINSSCCSNFSLMKIASFGARAPGANIEAVDFFSDRAVADFDAAFYDLEGLIEDWLKGDVYQSKQHGVLAPGSFQSLLTTLERRGKEMRKFVDLGRPVVLFPSVFPALKHADRNGKWLDVPELAAFFPASGNAVRPGSGDRLELKGPPELVQFGQRLAKHFHYRGVLSKALGQPAFFAPGTNQTVGAFLCDEKRWVLTCPRLGTPEGWNDFAAAFLELYESTGADAALPPLPDWHEQYLIPGEAEVADAIAEIERAVGQLTGLLETKRAEKAELGYLKRLFTDTGGSLGKAVRTALEGLGFKVEPGPGGRDDLVATFGQAVAVVEVKGKDAKSASDADATQLDKSIHRYFDEHGVLPKGILVVNGFRGTSIDARTEAVFPAGMLGYSNKRGHCLITGLQLLCLYFEARAKNNAARARLELLDTVGPFPRYTGNEWQSIVLKRTE
jgi:hypothetical protein